MAEPTTGVSLVADVGGTNTRVALARGSALMLDSVQRFRNADHTGLDAVLAQYLETSGATCQAAAVAIAGPVRNGRGRLTNLDWSADTDMLHRLTKGRTLAVLNDLQAQAHALGHIAPENLASVVARKTDAGSAPCLVIGFGTGMNAALALDSAGGKLVPASECGHVTLPVVTEDEMRLAQFVTRKVGHASVEDVLSGRGIETVYAWRASEMGRTETRSAAEIMGSVGTDPLAEETVATFIRLMARVVGDLALVHLPFGGVYLIGGVTRSMKPYMASMGFAASFRAKGRFAPFMDQFEVSVVEDDFAALAGLAQHVAELDKNLN